MGGQHDRGRMRSVVVAEAGGQGEMGDRLSGGQQQHHLREAWP